MNPIAAFAWMVGLMVAPHTFALVGNVAGTLHTTFPVWMAVAAFIYWINASSLADFSYQRSKPKSAIMGAVIEGLSLSSRWMTTIMLSTVLLVTAGFTFNETFLYWFPNFAFAFILLGALVLVHLLGSKAARLVQIVLIGVVTSGLMVLLATGIWQIFGGFPDASANRLPFHLSSLPAVALVFVGFDLALDHDPKSHEIRVRRYMFWGIFTMAVMLVLWGWVSLQVVSADRLSDSFIPHIITARTIGGEIGRMIMGMMIIAGSLSAVSALMSSVSRTKRYAGEDYSSRKPSWPDRFNRPAIWVFVASVTIGLMMAGGMAGTDIIDSYVRAGLILWLLFYGAIHVSLLVERTTGDNATSGPWSEWMRPLIGAISMIGCSVTLILVNPDKAAMLKISVAGLLMATMVAWAKRRWHSVLENERNSEGHRPFRLNGRG